MTTAQLNRLAAGRERARKLRDRESLARVRAYHAYLPRARCRPDGTWPRVSSPPTPTDADYAAARRLDPSV